MNALDMYTAWFPEKLMSNSAEYARRSEELRSGLYPVETLSAKRNAWYQAQQFRAQQLPNHKSAAQLFANFATEFFGDLVVLNLLLDTESKSHKQVTESLAKNTLALEPWISFDMLSFDPYGVYGVHFGQTIFAKEVANIQKGMDEIAKLDRPVAPVHEATPDLMLNAGAKAVLCYVAYATAHGQFELQPPIQTA